MKTNLSGAETGGNEQAGWDHKSWCPLVKLAKATVYKLPKEMRPRSVKLGKRRIITESPREWLARIASLHEAA